MTTESRRLLPWIPQVLGILVSLFIGLFALDAFDSRQPLDDAIIDFAAHVLPAFMLLAIVAFSWRREWLGALAFIGFALLYSIAMSRGRLDWILIIAGPLFVVGLLFFWTWMSERSEAGS